MMTTPGRAPCPARRATTAVGWASAALVTAGIVASADNLAAFLVQPDFGAYYLAARADAADQSMYSDAVRAALARDLQLPAAAYAGSTWYLYPPALAVALRPVAAFSFTEAALIWLALNAALTALAVYRLVRLFRWRRPPALLAAAFALLLPGTQQTLLHGQINWLPLLAMVFCIRDWSRAHGQTGGLVLGVASAFKLFPALLATAAPRGYRVQAWIAAAGGAAAVLVISWATAGPMFLQEWPGALAAHSARSFAADGSNQSLAAVLARTVPGAPPALATFVSAAIVGTSVVAVLVLPSHRPRRIDIGLRLGLLTMASLTALPLAWDHYHVLLVVPAVVFLLAARRDPSAWVMFLAGALLLLVHRFWRPLVAIAPVGAFTGLGLAGTFLWFVTAARLLATRGDRRVDA
jgi:alpha-1,2-mannosyltransferase